MDSQFCTLHQKKIRQKLFWVLIVVAIGIMYWQGSTLQSANQKTEAAKTSAAMEHERLQLLVDSSPVAMVLVDDNDNITVYNNAAEKLFGKKLESGYDYYAADLLPKEVAAKYEVVIQEAYQQLMEKKGNWKASKTVEGAFVEIDDKRVNIRLSICGIKYGDKIEFVVVALKKIPDHPHPIGLVPLNRGANSPPWQQQQQMEK